MNMSEIIMPTNLVVKDKATAMQYAISQARVYNKKERCYELDLELAKGIFKLFCYNVELPDVADGGCCGECPTDFESKKPLSYYSKLSNVINDDFNEEDNKIAEELDKHISESLIKNGETTAKTYDDIAEELFGKEKESWCIIGDAIPLVQTNALFDIPDKSVRCTSHKQTQKVMAINCLMNVAGNLFWNPGAEMI